MAILKIVSWQPCLVVSCCQIHSFMNASTKSTLKSFLGAVAWLLFAIAGLSFWIGGRIISEFTKTSRVFGEMAGIFISLVCLGLGALAKSAGEEDDTAED
jgi:hypothetical protein